MAAGCKSFKQMMQAVLDGELGSEERARLDDHLASCEACRAEFASYELSIALFIAMPAPEPGPSFAAEAVRKARQAKQVQVKRQRTFTWAMAAAITIVSVAALGTWSEVFKPILWGIITGIPLALRELISLFSALGSAAATLGKAFFHLGDILAMLSWEGVVALFPAYVIALATIIFMSLISRARRPAAKLPVLSL